MLKLVAIVFNAFAAGALWVAYSFTGNSTLIPLLGLNVIFVGINIFQLKDRLK